ncbi:Clp protease ClpP [Macrococcoides goetzii]|uniref:ATP-dependent Clp protease proteolytic subunit n=1 Tax=Macrococcoides goetzii TaxID=1891097 RepID=A0A2G5NWK0_9STAP|nr:head maturation protease, ClpP-related [Macrococcus goetzii]RAI79305.1 Clp protease ClpP [Macrococcus goetzii]
MTNRILNVSKTDNVGQIDIYGEIVPETWRWAGEESAYHFKDTLEKLGDVEEITVNINSPGGDVYEGIAIHNMLKRHKAKVIVNIDGLAASIASVIAMAGDVVRMPNNAMIMIHNAMSGVVGNANDLREVADLLDKVTSTLMNTYLEKTDKLNTDTLKALLDAETWLTAEEAFSYGFIDEVITSKKLVACASKEQLDKFRKTPSSISNNAGDPIVLSGSSTKGKSEKSVVMVETPKETNKEKVNVIKVEIDSEEFKATVQKIIKETLEETKPIENKTIKKRLYL